MRTTQETRVWIKTYISSLDEGSVPLLAPIATAHAEPDIYNQLCAEYYGPLDGLTQEESDLLDLLRDVAAHGGADE